MPTIRTSTVKVSVVLTSASSHAQWFLRTQLTPFLQALPQLLSVELIPYGNVTEDGRCEFGLGDCLGNWMVSCAARHLPGSSAVHLAFSTCLMHHTTVLRTNNFTGIMDTAVHCAAGFPDEISDLYNCGVSEEGYQLFLDAGRRQRELAPVVTEVPLLALNEVPVVRRVSQLGQFPALLCHHLQGEAAGREYCQRLQQDQEEAEPRV